MDNPVVHTDLGVGKLCFAPQLEGKDKAEQLSAAAWKELDKVAGAVKDTIKQLPGSDTVKRICDSLPLLLKPVPPKKSEWTISIDFTTDFGDGQGVESGLDRLQAFAKRTKGKDVTIVAQAAVPDSFDFDFFSGVKIATPGTKYTLQKYVVKNGEIKLAAETPSKGYAEDLEELLTYAGKNQPSKRSALIIDSHGVGNEGLLGDTGKASVDDFVKAVQNGLKANGQEKLDMLDFDACLMGASEALARVSKITDNLVASAETESIYQGQNYIAPFTRLLEKPETDGKTLARDIVASTHKDMEDWKKEGWHPTVETLAHFQLREYAEFRKSLDSFGDKLAVVVNEKNNREIIENAIDKSRKYGSLSPLFALLGGGTGGRNRADIKEFTENIISAIDSGEIEDPDRQIKKAAQEVLNKRSILVDSYHGNEDFARAGGVSDFLPSKYLRNISKEASLQTSAGRLCNLTEPKNFDAIDKTEKTRTEFLQKVQAELFWNRPVWIFPGLPGVSKEVEAMDKHSEAFRKAETAEKRAAAFKLMHESATALNETEIFKNAYNKEYSKMEANVSKVYKANFVEEGTSGWSKFRLKLKDSK